MSKSHDQKSQHLSGMFDGSAGGFLPSQCYSNRACNNVNDLDIDRLSSVGDINDVSDINDLLEILHRQDASSFSCNGGPLNFDILQSNAFDDVTPLMQEVLRQSPVTADRRSVGSMPRASALMSSSDHVGGGQRFPEMQGGNGMHQVFYFSVLLDHSWCILVTGFFSDVQLYLFIFLFIKLFEIGGK